MVLALVVASERVPVALSLERNVRLAPQASGRAPSSSGGV